jgi:hypothetical protein
MESGLKCHVFCWDLIIVQDQSGQIRISYYTNVFMSNVYHRCFHAPHANALMSPLVFICGTELCWSTTGVWILLALLGKLCCSLYIPSCSMYTWLCVLYLEYEYLSSDGSRVSWDSPVIKVNDYDLNRGIKVLAEAGIIVCLGASQPAITWLLGYVFLGWISQSVKLTICLCLMGRLSMHGALHLGAWRHFVFRSLGID